MLAQLIMTAKGLMLLFGAIYAFAWLLKSEEANWVKGAPRILMPAMFMIGMWGQFVWIPFCALLIMITKLSRTRGEAAALYALAVLSIPTLNYKVVFGSLYLLTLNKWLFCALGLGIAYFAKGSRGEKIGSRFDIPFLLIFILEAAQTRDPSTTETLRQLTPVLLTLPLPYFLLTRSLTRKEDLHRFLLAIALGGFIMASVAFVESRFHWLMYKTIENNLHVSGQLNAYMKMRGGIIRAPASFPESTSLANYLALTWVALLALRNSFASAGKWYLAIGIVMLGLLAANSRGGFMGVGIGTLAFDFYCRRYGQMFAKVGMLGAAYAMLLGLAQVSPYFASVIGDDKGTSMSSDYRTLLLRRGLEEISKHPYLGTNLKKAIDNLQDIRQGEGLVDLVNGYIAYGLTLGYAGIIGLAAAFVCLGVAMMLARRSLSVSTSTLEIGGVVFAVAALTMVSSFYNGFGGANSTPFYEMAALGSAIWALRRHVLRDGSSAATAVNDAAVPAIRRMIEADRAAAKARGAGRPARARGLPTPMTAATDPA